MENIKFIILLIVYLFLANVTLLIDGYSYIGYAALFSLSFGIHAFSSGIKNIFQKTVYHVIFLVSLLYLITEISYKFSFYTELFNPTEFNFLYYLAFFYLIITLLLLWYKNQSLEN